MTTITVEEDIALKNTQFKTVQELMSALRSLSPLELFAVDEESISPESLKKINVSRKNQQKNLTDFRG